MADFGNRIPALTFEVIADDEPVTVEALLEPLARLLTLQRPLDGLQGLGNEGGPLSQSLASIDQLYPMVCDAGGDKLSIGTGDALPDVPPTLPEAAAANDGQSFAAATGVARRHQADASEPPATPVEGETWLIAEAATGQWAGEDGKLASRQSGNWLLTSPRDGMRLLDRSTGQMLLYRGGWQRPMAPAVPGSGAVVDAEAREAIAELVAALTQAGVFPSS